MQINQKGGKLIQIKYNLPQILFFILKDLLKQAQKEIMKLVKISKTMVIKLNEEIFSKIQWNLLGYNIIKLHKSDR